MKLSKVFLILSVFLLLNENIYSITVYLRNLTKTDAIFELAFLSQKKDWIIVPHETMIAIEKDYEKQELAIVQIFKKDQLRQKYIQYLKENLSCYQTANTHYSIEQIELENNSVCEAALCEGLIYQLKYNENLRQKKEFKDLKSCSVKFYFWETRDQNITLEHDRNKFFLSNKGNQKKGKKNQRV